MPMKSDFEILMDLRKEVSRSTSFLVLLAFLILTMSVVWSSYGARIVQLEASIAELKGQNDE